LDRHFVRDTIAPFLEEICFQNAVFLHLLDRVLQFTRIG
jgi:hypothetical protein